MKKIISLLIVICVCFSAISVFAYDEHKVFIDKHQIKFDVEPVMFDGRILVPMRKIFETMGAAVTWLPETSGIIAEKGDIKIEMQIENPDIFVNSEKITLDVSPKLIEGNTLVPVRAVAEGLNAKVEWVQETGTVLITSPSIKVMKNVTVDKSDEKKPIVTITTETNQIIKAELYPEIAPVTVENFIKLIDDDFYNGLNFHRIEPGFVIQGGCPIGNGTGGPGWKIKGEFTSNGFKNDLKHERGILSMARAADPDSAGSQFFIMLGAAPHLDGEYAAFGKVLEGMDVVDEIVDPKAPKNNDIEEKSKPVLDFSKDTTGALQILHKSLRYDFEQSMLPEEIFGDSKDEMIKNLKSGDIEAIDEFINASWEFAVSTYILRYMMDAEETFLISDKSDINMYIDKFKNEFMLNTEQNFNTSFVKPADDIYAVVIDLAELEDMLISTYVGIAYNEKSGLKYFTLEKSFDDNFMFCGVFEDSRGSYGLIPNDKASFTEAMGIVMNNGNSPAATQKRN